MKINTKPQSLRTHEGAKAKHINHVQMLRRSVMSCMLWEDTFYEDGQSIADRIKSLVEKVPASLVKSIAIEARTKMHLRHIPLLLAREMARIHNYRSYVAETLETIIQRPDEITEFMAMYWKDGKCPIASQVKKGLAKAFQKFDEYHFAKYDRDSTVKLRDALFLCHSKPKDSDKKRYNKEDRKNKIERMLSESEIVYKKITDRTLTPPDTWEVQLSAGKDKKETFERLMAEKKLGGLAFLRNLRNMKEAGISKSVIADYFKIANLSKILPFQFIAAARHNPEFESLIEAFMLVNLGESNKLPGKTIILVDVSGSMDSMMSGKSQISFLDAACGVAMICREICDDVRVYSFSYEERLVPDRHGFALRDAIVNSQGHGGTQLGHSLKNVMAANKDADRIIVITDEQSHDAVADPHCKGYIINVASYQNGVGYGSWVHVDGFSEAVIKWIQAYEDNN